MHSPRQCAATSPDCRQPHHHRPQQKSRRAGQQKRESLPHGPEPANRCTPAGRAKCPPQPTSTARSKRPGYRTSGKLLQQHHPTHTPDAAIAPPTNPPPTNGRALVRACVSACVLADMRVQQERREQRGERRGILHNQPTANCPPPSPHLRSVFHSLRVCCSNHPSSLPPSFFFPSLVRACADGARRPLSLSLALPLRPKPPC